MNPLPLLRKYLWWIVFGACLALGAGYLGLRWWQGVAVVGERVVRRDFVQTVVATGRVENPHRIEIGAQITGTVVRVPVQEGQSVHAGDVLVQLSNAELLAAQRQAEIAVAQAQARLRQVQEVQAPLAQQALRQAQVTADFARATLRRNQDLFAQNFIGAAALDESRKALDLALAQQGAAQQQLNTTGTQGSDFAIAQTAVAQAQASAAAAQARTQYAQIRALVDGVLISRSVEAGDVVQAGKALMALSPHGRSQLVLAIDEKNLHLLQIGQAALASADAYPQRKFAATLVYINPGAGYRAAACLFAARHDGVGRHRGGTAQRHPAGVRHPGARGRWRKTVGVEGARRPRGARAGAFGASQHRLCRAARGRERGRCAAARHCRGDDRGTGDGYRERAFMTEGAGRLGELLVPLRAKPCATVVVPAPC